jgi:YcaO-like protein with predicted kinase domain
MSSQTISRQPDDLAHSHVSSPEPSDPPVMVRGVPMRARKLFYRGTHRCVAPEETMARITPHLRTAGITRLADITGLDRIGMPVTIAYRPNGRTLSSAAGKGFTLAASQASAAMEGIELHHAENPRLPALHLSYAELAERMPVIPEERLPLTRHALFSANRREFWVTGWDLVAQCEVGLPLSSVAMIRHAHQKPMFARPFIHDSNGLASGNHLLEAVVAGLYEVLERDAVSCHRWAQDHVGHVVPKVRQDTIEWPLAVELLERFRAAGTAAVLYDCSVGSELAVYEANLYDERVRHVGVTGGYGAHLDPETAMIRALTEAAQSRLIYISGARDDIFRHDDRGLKVSDNARTIAGLASRPGTVDARERSNNATSSFEGDLHRLLELVQRAGLEQVIVADLTHEELGIPVARVVVPGLEGYRTHVYVPGPRARAFAAAHRPDA